MVNARKLLIVLAALVLLLTAWLWWNRPQEVDMAAYVPADSLVFIEANNLPRVASCLVSTDAWKALAPFDDVTPTRINWLTRFAAWTGIGTAEAVVFARSQMAVTLMDIDAGRAGEGLTLNIKPRAAIVLETHTGERRVRAAIEKLVGNFARRAYGEPRIERRETDEAAWIIWSAPEGERRIVSAVADSVAIIGNDQATVEACLAVRRGERPSLAGNADLEVMRGRVDSGNALASGYISPSSAARLTVLAASLYAAQSALNPRAQSTAAALLPQLTDRIIGGAAWSTRLNGGKIEDHYFIAVKNNLAARLQEPLAPSIETNEKASELLPSGAYQLTHYNLRDPEKAWRSFNAMFSSQIEMPYALLVSRFLDTALEPYGIQTPATFLPAAGPDLWTARLDDAGESTLMIAKVRDADRLRAEVRKRLGARTRTEKVGEAELLISSDAERGAAGFVAGYLIMGAERDVRQALQAHATPTSTLAASGVFTHTQQTAHSEASVITYTNDEAATRSFIYAIARLRQGANRQQSNSFEQSLAALPYSLSATRVVEGGFEKRTLSSFGQFGAITTLFETNATR
ncbi:MAG: hypothetical protein H0V88_08465 [Pyrinomonadaceae bacterium]|nr:hypothetical protein [Pyrinomonadaceae bacterium]